jgi:hypothetical protein
VPDPELVERVGVGRREVGNDDIRRQQLLVHRHIDSPGMAELVRSDADEALLLDDRLDQQPIRFIEVERAPGGIVSFDAKPHHDEAALRAARHACRVACHSSVPSALERRWGRELRAAHSGGVKSFDAHPSDRHRWHPPRSTRPAGQCRERALQRVRGLCANWREAEAVAVYARGPCRHNAVNRLISGSGDACARPLQNHKRLSHILRIRLTTPMIHFFYLF